MHHPRRSGFGAEQRNPEDRSLPEGTHRRGGQRRASSSFTACEAPMIASETSRSSVRALLWALVETAPSPTTKSSRRSSLRSIEILISRLDIFSSRSSMNQLYGYCPSHPRVLSLFRTDKRPRVLRRSKLRRPEGPFLLGRLRRGSCHLVTASPLRLWRGLLRFSKACESSPGSCIPSQRASWLRRSNGDSV